METLKGKNILITGATGGIGSETARLLKVSGANLFLTGRNEAKLQQVASDCNVTTENTFALDISNGAAVDELKEKYFQQLPTIDILINAAGIGIIKTMETLDEQDFLRSLNYNLYAPFLLLKAFLPAMKELKKASS
ncbi:MAG: SDR family oxidoreductase [Chitinophagaceae bacterium]|nr:SDR family oxidoreductase [Chitinophagaceae bacterium]